MKRTLLILIGLVVFLSINLVLITRYRIVASEGYPTWEATRNFLLRSGEIKVDLPNTVEIMKAHCDDPRGEVHINGNTVITKIGHSGCVIEIQTRSEGGTHTYFINSQRLNNWNRIHFFPADAEDPQTRFIKVENGITKTHTDIIRESIPIKSEVQNVSSWIRANVSSTALFLYR